MPDSEGAKPAVQALEPPRPSHRRAGGVFLGVAKLVAAVCGGALVGGVVTGSTDFAFAILPLGVVLVGFCSFAGYVLQLLAGIEQRLWQLGVQRAFGGS